MRRICLPMLKVEFPDASRKGSLKLGVKLRILLKISLIKNRVILVKSLVKPIRHITVGTTRIRGYRLALK